MMARRICITIIILLTAALFTLTAGAESATVESDEYISQIRGGISGDAATLLPDGDGFPDAGFFAGTAVEIIRGLLEPTLSVFTALTGALLISAVLAARKNSGMSAPMSAVCDYVSLLCITLTAFGTVSRLWDSVAAVTGALTTLMTALVPVSATLLAAGGNTAAAATGSAGLALMTSLTESLGSALLTPLLKVCLSLALVSALSGGVDLSGLSSLIRGAFTLGLSALMMLMTAIIAAQTSIAAGADTLALRSVRFAAGAFIPVVGGALSEAASTLAGGVGYLRSTVGGFAVVAVFLTSLPLLLELLLNRLLFGLMSAAARALGCPRESALLNELAELLGSALALLAALTAMFILTLTAIVKTACGWGVIQ